MKKTCLIRAEGPPPAGTMLVSAGRWTACIIVPERGGRVERERRQIDLLHGAEDEVAVLYRLPDPGEPTSAFPLRAAPDRPHFNSSREQIGCDAVQLLGESVGRARQLVATEAPPVGKEGKFFQKLCVLPA